MSAIQSDLPINPNEDLAWDGASSAVAMARWASSDGSGDKDTIDWNKYRLGFLWYDEESPENFGSYKLGFADVFDGEPRAVWRGIATAYAVMQGSMGGVDIPDADRNAVMDVIASYYEKFNEDMEKEDTLSETNIKSVDERIDYTATFKTVEKAALEYGEVEVVVSNSGVDRHGESINVDGIDLSQIKRNPVVLWAHDYSSLPIGKITKIWKTGGNLMARFKLATNLYDFADTVYKMIKEGVISAVSIGGIVRQWNPDGMSIDKLEMVELSVVPVGAHRDALVSSKSFSRDTIARQYESFLVKALSAKIGESDEITGHIDTLEKILAALRETEKATPQVTQVEAKRVLIKMKQLSSEADREIEQLNKVIKIKLKGE